MLLGPASELGRAATLRRDDLGAAVLRRWLDLVGPEQLVVEVVSHRLPGSGPGSSPHAARMAGLARSGGRRGWGPAGVTTVLSNAVRFADRLDAPTVDVLDATRRLVPMDVRHLDRSNAEGFLKSGKQMHEVAEEICRYAGLGEHGSRGATELLAATRTVADQCVLDPREDLGIGEVHFPEFEVTSIALSRRWCPVLVAGTGLRGLRGERGWDWPPGARTSGARSSVTARGSRPPTCRAPRPLRGRDRVALRRPPTAADLEAARRRARRRSASSGFASYFLTVGDVTAMIRELGIRSAARGSGAGSLVNYLLGISGVDPIRHGLLMERFLSPLRQSLPDIDIDVESARRLEVYDAILDRFGSDRCATVSMMDTYKVRHAIRDVGAALGMPMGEIDAIAKAFPHIRARDARMALRELARAALHRPGPGGGRGGVGQLRPVLPAGGEPRRAAPAHRDAPVRRTPLRPHPARPHPGGAELPGLPDEPVRQGGRRGPRPAQARRARHPDAVGDGPRGGRDRAHGGPPHRSRRRGAGALRRPHHLLDDLLAPRPWASSRSSRPDSASWSASPGSRTSPTSSPTSRCSGRGRSRAT